MTTTASTAPLTASDRELLRRPLHGFLSVGTARPRPVWFELTDDDALQLFTEADAPKVRRIAADPAVSMIVAAPVGEREHWVSVVGRASVEPDGAADLAARLADRYWDLTDPDRVATLEAIQAGELLRIVIRPESVARYAL